MERRPGSCPVRFPELQVPDSQHNKPIPLTPPGSFSTTPAGSRNSTRTPPKLDKGNRQRGLAPGSSNQDVNSLSECLSIQTCRGFLPIKKWDQRSQPLAEMENALAQLHGLKKLGVLGRKFPQPQVHDRRQELPIALTPPGSQRTAPTRSRNSSHTPMHQTRVVGRHLGPGSSNQLWVEKEQQVEQYFQVRQQEWDWEEEEQLLRQRLRLSPGPGFWCSQNLSYLPFSLTPKCNK